MLFCFVWLAAGGTFCYFPVSFHFFCMSGAISVVCERKFFQVLKTFTFKCKKKTLALREAETMHYESS